MYKIIYGSIKDLTREKDLSRIRTGVGMGVGWERGVPMSHKT